MGNDQTADQRCIISMAPPTRGQHRLAVLVALVLIVAVVLTVPFARMRVEGTAGFLSVYATFVGINDVITSIMLIAVCSVQFSRAILTVAMAYLFTGLTIIPWVLTFPAVQSDSGLLAGGIQTTATIAAARLFGLPLFMLAYIYLKEREHAGTAAPGPVGRSVAVSIVAVIVSVIGIAWLSVMGGEMLPHLMLDRSQTAPLWDKVLAVGMSLSVVALVLLLIRRRSVLDTWLCVVLLMNLLENLMLGVFSAGRLSIGWWAGRIYGITAASVVLCVLLSEMTTLYARLIHSVSSERRAREARLMAMESLSASVAHEISQPLASMVTNAEAGLRWLDRHSPDLDETKGALQRIVEDGQRASDVIANIRSVFRKGTADRLSVRFNEAIGDVLATMATELGHLGIAVTTSLDARLPLVMGNPVQLKQLIWNLITNATEAMTTIPSEERSLHLCTTRQNNGFILVVIEDTGEGLDPHHRSQIFETIFTTKQHGSGMGLVISRSIVEAHGGQIWLENSKTRGAVARFTLPIAL